jgi:hypothetical protein
LKPPAAKQDLPKPAEKVAEKKDVGNLISMFEKKAQEKPAFIKKPRDP